MQPPLTQVDTPHCPSRVGEEGRFQKTAALPGRPASGNTQALELWLGGLLSNSQLPELGRLQGLQSTLPSSSECILRGTESGRGGGAQACPHSGLC